MNESELSEISSVFIPEEQKWRHLLFHLVYLQHKNSHLQRQVNYLLCNIMNSWQLASRLNWTL